MAAAVQQKIAVYLCSEIFPHTYETGAQNTLMTGQRESTAAATALLEIIGVKQDTM